MAVVSFASAKGGVGKTTLAVNVAAELALDGIPVTILDCDVNRHATQFCTVFGPANPNVQLRVLSDINKMNFVSRLSAAQSASDIVVIDLPAGTSDISLRAIMMSNLVVIPAQKTVVDIRDAARTAAQVAEAEHLTRQEIRSVLVWSMVKARWETRTEKVVTEEFLGMLTDPSRAVLSSPLLEYDAFPAGFFYGWVPRQHSSVSGQPVSLTSLDGTKTSLTIPGSTARAARNVTLIARDIVSRLNEIAAGRDPGKLSLRPEILEVIRRSPGMEES